MTKLDKSQLPLSMEMVLIDNNGKKIHVIVDKDLIPKFKKCCE